MTLCVRRGIWLSWRGHRSILAPHDFRDRNQYLHAETTFEHLLRLDVVPIVNENDAVADDAIRYGDNDRIAALVANLLRADLLVLLTDTPGVLTADPRIEPSATLIEEIAAIDQAIEEVGTAGSRGSGEWLPSWQRPVWRPGVG